MMTYNENRHAERHGSEETIQYAFLNSDRFFSAHALNYSRGGLCFLSGYEIRPRAHLYLTVDDSDCVHDCKEIGAGRFAEVRWCRKLPHKPAFFYRIGVQYKEAVDEEPVL
jgi:hypothetical protein